MIQDHDYCRFRGAKVVSKYSWAQWICGIYGGGLLCCALSFGCATPVPDLWPPKTDAPTRTIIVSLDNWHAMIAFPRPKKTELLGKMESQSSALNPQSSELNPQSFYFEEWGYAERAWYLDNRQGILGVLRALFWPTVGVVEVSRQSQVWSKRSPDSPTDQFTFYLSEAGYQRIQAYLQATRAPGPPIVQMRSSTFYPAEASYHLFHHCHQYAAGALRAAGLPISPLWAWSRGPFAWQLEQAEEMTENSRRKLKIF